jgi:hypothetical protein
MATDDGAVGERQSQQYGDAIRGSAVMQQEQEPLDRAMYNQQFHQQHIVRGNSVPQYGQLFKNEAEIYTHEKLLLEQDAHLLEEQRYLNRLRNSEIRQNRHLNEHYNKITKPMIERQRMMNELENRQIEQRLEAFNNYQQRQMELKKELNQIQAQALTRQIESSQKKRAAESYKMQYQPYRQP